MKKLLYFISFMAMLALSACSTSTVAPTDKPAKKPDASSDSQATTAIQPPSPTNSTDKGFTKSIHKSSTWSALTDWEKDDLSPAWQAFLKSCSVLNKQTLWQKSCKAATTLNNPDNATLAVFFSNNFTPYQIINKDNTEEGLVTGYYEPLLKGSRKPSQRYRFAIHAAPPQLLTINLGTTYPEIKDLRLRGRLEGNKILPYYTRAEIMQNPKLLSAHEFLWVEDEVELFFLHVQGSGRIQLENGDIVKIGYADQNGHPYNSIGKILVQRGELKLENASMQGIKQWGRKNPSKLPELLKQNARYVFFRELPADISGPIGALGVPLTAGRSIAIDPLSVPQGAPVFLATTWPNTSKPLNRLMVAQDVGSAITGGVRADFFWGFGEEAATQAGKMKQPGKMWVLLPKNNDAY
ncbi:MAG TPA: murein transglycosylase A [Nitrosomonas sp.]|nr:murein transglycosylase A [Nitrosomonas sp.]HQX13528.1 murein transglycosylase A [Nitrosomonas sp.]HRB32914.1 murein transglycosylase A [Nitrosomonas sp.]HRB45575.1 murein transglycosylase A [Nitrosomonas sp.]HRB77580.1 murein transglycosylase A [Nitrosomonas sp.]